MEGYILNKQTFELLTPDNIHIEDNLGKTSFGCNQEWYGSYWQRLSGCGPSTASTILLYLHKAKNISLPFVIKDMSDCIKLMETVWSFVTPTMKGVNVLDKFYNGVHAFTQAQGYNLESFYINIPQKKEDRPEFLTVINFIAKGLQQDSPVAFLNLSNGRVRNLDKWHWVTITSLEAQDNEHVYTKIYDGAKTIIINLKLWYDTTSRGGGFVFFK